jgi:hypothetical protein
MASEDTTTTPKKKVTSRAEAGLVEADAEIQPQDEAIAAGEAFSEEALEADVLIQADQSAVKISGMSEEEQFMDMTPVIVGPPAYGSPDPLSSAGRLLPLDQHPFNPDSLPDDHPSRIDPEYGKGYQADLTSDEIGGQFPGAPQRTDLERDQQGASAEEAPDYDSMTKADLQAEAESRGLTVSSTATKAEIVQQLRDDDAAA